MGQSCAVGGYHLAALRQEDGALAPAKSFFSSHGISPSAGLGFLLLLSLAAGLLLFANFSHPPNLHALVLSSGAPVAGAAVQVLAQDGTVLSSGVTDEKGKLELPARLSSRGRLILKASKKGFVAANGEPHAIAVLDATRYSSASVELFSTELEAQEYFGEISFLVLDKVTGAAVSGATLNIAAGGKTFPLSVNDQGRASLQLEKSLSFRVKVSAPGYYSDSFSLLALRPVEKILLSPRTAQQVSFDSGEEKFPPSQITSSDNLLDSPQQSNSFFMPQARVEVLDAQGNSVQSGSLSIVSSSGQEIFSVPIENGAAFVPSIPVSDDFTLSISSATRASLDGSVRVFDAATNNLVFTTAILAGRALLSQKSISAAASPASSGALVLSASTLAGAPSTATFTLPNGASCAGSSCALAIPPAGNALTQAVSVTTPEGNSFVATIQTTSGAISFASIAIPPANPASASANQVNLLGAFDEQGRQVSSLLPGKRYSLKFSLYSNALDETVFSVRLGPKTSVAQEDYALLDFISEDFTHSTKSVSYSPKPVCDDLNNGLSLDGLYKWEQLFFQNKGAPLQKILLVPFFVKPTARAATSPEGIEIFYRLEGKSGATYSRIPSDAVLGTSENSLSKSGCYAQEARETLPLALLSGCSDGTALNECSSNKPFSCARNSAGVLELKPTASCCPPATVFSPATSTCVSTSPTDFASQAKCSDGTSENSCSILNKPRACIGGRLAISSSCCNAGEVFESNFCRPRAPCRIGSFTFADGACLPTRPGLCRGGLEASAPEACGCPTGTSFDASRNTCATSSGTPIALVATCSDGTSLNACSSSQPRQCVSLGGKLSLESNALACGCPDGQISNGVSCRSRTTNAPGSTPAPTSPPFFSLEPTPTPAPRACTEINSCISPGTSDDYCNSAGTVGSSCFTCNRDCGGNSNLYCNFATGSCEPKKCSVPSGRGTPIGQCVVGSFSAYLNNSYRPLRCVSDPDGNAIVISDAGACGCPSGQKPDFSGEVCVACEQSDCSDAGFACKDSDGKRLTPFECLDEKFSEVHDATSDAVKRCLPDGSIEQSIGSCGCPSGFQQSQDGKQCEKSPLSRIDFSSLERGAACANCVENDTIYFDQGGSKLRTLSGEASFQMVADAIFPQDSFKLLVRQPSSAQFRISVKRMESSSGATPCYAYDASTGALIFRASTGGDACPIVVRGNNFFVQKNSGENGISQDNLTIIFTTESVPPIELAVRVFVRLSSSEGIQVVPTSISGPSTPQLFYILNQKNDASPRVLKITALSEQNIQLEQARAQALAFRGPGFLSVDEGQQRIAGVSYSESPSFFACTGGVGGEQVSSASDWRDCMSGWCTPAAFKQAYENFKQYARSTALSTAFRRGQQAPWNRLHAGEPFKQVMVAQVVDGAARTVTASGIVLSGFSQCGNFSMPGVFEITASTLDGESYQYTARPAALRQFDYIDGSCNSNSSFQPDSSRPEVFAPSQLLCRFLYGKCDTAQGGACIERDSTGNLVTSQQNAVENANAGAPPFFPFLPPFGLGGPGGLGGQGGGGGGGGGFGGGNDVDPLDGLSEKDRELLAQMPSHLYSPFEAKTNEEVKAPKDAATFSSPGDAAANKLKPKADELDKKYGEARKKTNDACSPPGEFRKGEKEFWIEKDKASVKKSLEGGSCFPKTDAVVTCALQVEFVIPEEKLKKTTEIIKVLDDCENKEHGPEKEKTLQKFAKTDCSQIKQLLGETRQKVIDEIALADRNCENKCEERDVTPKICAGGYCSRLEECLLSCSTAATEAKKRLDETIGKPEEIDKIFEKTGKEATATADSSASESTSNSCAAAIRKELSSGDDCELFNKQFAGADKIKGLLVEPLGPLVRRTAWATLYAYGEGQDEDSGKCVLVCQNAYSFVHVFSASRKVFAVEKFGLNSACEPKAPEKTKDIHLDDPNKMLGFLNSFMPYGGESKGSFLTPGYVGGMKIALTPGTGKHTVEYPNGNSFNKINFLSQPNFFGTYGQQAIRDSRIAAFKYMNLDPNQFDVNVRFTNGWSDGDSHGLAMAMGMVSAARNVPLPSKLKITGAIGPSGRVGDVSGVGGKAYYVKLSGATDMIVPNFEHNTDYVKWYKLTPHTPNTLSEALRIAEKLRSGGGSHLSPGESSMFHTNHNPQIKFEDFSGPFDGQIYPSNPKPGAGVLPSIGKPSIEDGKFVLVPFQLSDIFNAEINAPAPIGSYSNKKVPDKLKPSVLKKKFSEEGKNDAGNIARFQESLAATLDPNVRIKFGDQPSEKPTQEDFNLASRNGPREGSNLAKGSVVNRINDVMQRFGVGPHGESSALDQQSQARANEMARTGKLIHSPLDGSYGGEIIAFAPTLNDALNAFLKSSNPSPQKPGHREILLNTFFNYRQVGVGWAQVPDSPNKAWVIQKK